MIAESSAVPVPGRGSQALDYVAWLNLSGASLNRDDPITADLDHVAMATAGILEPVATAGTKFEPLIGIANVVDEAILERNTFRRLGQTEFERSKPPRGISGESFFDLLARVERGHAV